MNTLLMANKKVNLFIVCFFLPYLFFGQISESWSSKTKYEPTADSLRQYDAISIFNNTEINLEVVDNEYYHKTVTIHQKIKLNTKKGIENYSKFELPDESFLKELRARTIKPDGKIINLQKSDIKFFTKKVKNSNATDKSSGQFIIPGISPGDEIEFFFKFKIPNSTTIPDYFFTHTAYSLYTKLKINVNYAYSFNFKLYNGAPAPIVTMGYDYKSIEWNVRNLKPFDQEKELIIYSKNPFVRFSINSITLKALHRRYITEINSWYEYWDKTRTQYFGLILDKEKEMSAFIDSLIGPELPFLNDSIRFSKLISAHHYLNKNIELMSNEEYKEEFKPADYIKKHKFPPGFYFNFYKYLLNRSQFQYYICLGRNKYLGDLDPQFKTQNQITTCFYVVKYKNHFYTIYPKTATASYNFNQTPYFIEGTTAIFVSKDDGLKTIHTEKIPENSANNNLINIYTYAYINKESNGIREKTKLLTTGSLSAVFRNAYESLKMDSLDDSEISKAILYLTKDGVDSLTIDRNETTEPYVFSLKYKDIKNEVLTQMDQSLYSLKLDRLITHFRSNDQNKTASIIFPFSDNIRYYVLFEKPIELDSASRIQTKFKNSSGTYDLTIEQLNPTTLIINSNVRFINSNDCREPSKEAQELIEQSNEIREKSLIYREL